MLIQLVMNVVVLWVSGAADAQLPSFVEEPHSVPLD